MNQPSKRATFNEVAKDESKKEIKMKLKNKSIWTSNRESDQKKNIFMEVTKIINSLIKKFKKCLLALSFICFYYFVLSCPFSKLIDQDGRKFLGNFLICLYYGATTTSQKSSNPYSLVIMYRLLIINHKSDFCNISSIPIGARFFFLYFNSSTFYLDK